MTQRKKLIEVALPLEAINAASAREKSIRHGHPSTLHLWWARRPLAACRAVLFAQLVDDPSSRPDEFPTEEAQEAERERLFEIIRHLVKWENSNNEHVLNAARAEILKSTNNNPPPVLDPFCGGGSIPLEAQRLGLEAHGSDLNPVAVLITKALIEIPPKFAGRPPVHPVKDKQLLEHEWRGASGLAEDVRSYGQWMRDEAEQRIGHLYPKVKLPKEYGGDPKSEATVIAWLWARTVKCPNPACGAMMPLVRSFALSTKKAKQAWVEPVIDGEGKKVSFEVKTGAGIPPDGTVNRRGARCVVCNETTPLDHVRAEGKAGRMGVQMMAIVAEGQRGRIYLPPSLKHEATAAEARPVDVPETNLPEQALGFRVQGYGMTKHRDLFTARQLVALTTFSDLVGEARERVLADGRKAGMNDDGKGISEGGVGATAYADAVATYLAFALSKMADRGSSICTWFTERDSTRNTFARQAIPMTWDFAELNTLLGGTGSFQGAVDWTAESLEGTPIGLGSGYAKQHDASAQIDDLRDIIFSTDPPYFDNVPYSDLSDFFYVWLRRSLSPVYPSLLGTMLTPKSSELVADPFRHGGKNEAGRFFEEGMRSCFSRMRETAHPEYPVSVIYAFKQAENDEDDPQGSVSVASTGWETMLEGLFTKGFQITGTWPMRTELGNRMRSLDSNALASSIVLVCRPRSESASPATRRELVTALKRELPDALKKLQHGNVAPVDFAQASIGPGMAIFSRYAKVLEADGKPMSVRTALQIINQELDAYLAAQEGELDRDTRFCLSWFEQYGMNEGPFGDADVMARARNTAVDGLVKAGVVHSKAGKVRLLKRAECPAQWHPDLDRRVTVWECTQHLIRQLDTGGIEAAARLVNLLGSRSEDARALAYRLYSICERKKWADEALAYNTLVVEWPAIQDRAAQSRVMPTVQEGLFG
jgi:putative DNA methylase